MVFELRMSPPPSYVEVMKARANAIAPPAYEQIIGGGGVAQSMDEENVTSMAASAASSDSRLVEAVPEVPYVDLEVLIPEPPSFDPLKRCNPFAMFAAKHEGEHQKSLVVSHDEKLHQSGRPVLTPA